MCPGKGVSIFPVFRGGKTLEAVVHGVLKFAVVEHRFVLSSGTLPRCSDSSSSTVCRQRLCLNALGLIVRCLKDHVCGGGVGIHRGFQVEKCCSAETSMPVRYPDPGYSCSRGNDVTFRISFFPFFPLWGKMYDFPLFRMSRDKCVQTVLSV